ncbi:MAG: hypothetical protein JXQ82_05735 [Methanomicrobiaceae archaeon]|nr:hypothetical protein [Methanomicrobiaceae archaeon]
MPEDKKNNEKDFNDIIKRILEEALRNGNFPFNGKFSISIAGGRLPIEIAPSNSDKYSHNSFNFDENNNTINNPHTEVHKSGKDILIYANIPGSDMSNTAISVHENTLCINSFTDGIKYTAEIKIPSVRKETMKYKSINGVLEISVKAIE